MGRSRHLAGPLPAEAPNAVHHEPHPPPLLWLSHEVPRPEEQGHPQHRGGECLLPQGLRSRGPGRRQAHGLGYFPSAPASPALALRAQPTAAAASPGPRQAAPTPDACVVTAVLSDLRVRVTSPEPHSPPDPRAPSGLHPARCPLGPPTPCSRSRSGPPSPTL